MSRNVLITGGNSGIGLEMARALAADGDNVIIASRDLSKSEQAANEIRSSASNANIEAMALDLGDFDNIDAFADALLQKMPVIDVLILNSGLANLKLGKLENGLEKMIGIMHFGHFRLTQKLRDAVVAADQGRIIVTSSVAHKLGKINEATFDNPSKHSWTFGGYAQAKLANLLFTRELARQLEGTNVTVNAFHPGAVSTGIWKDLPGPAQKVVRLFLVSPKQGADTAIWLANTPAGKNNNGEYFCRRKIASSTPASKDMKKAKWLWDTTQARM